MSPESLTDQNSIAAMPSSVGSTSSASSTTSPVQIGTMASTAVQHFVRSELKIRKEELAWTFANMARIVRGASVTLRDNKQVPIAQYTDKAAAEIEGASLYLHQHDLNSLITDVEGFARRQPALFIAGGLLLGLAAARFLKSTQHAAE